MRCPVLLLLLAALGAAPSRAQACRECKPVACTPHRRLESFTLTEFSYNRRYGRSPVDWVNAGGGVPAATWEFGGMGNQGPNWAVGGTLFVTSGPLGGRMGIKVRYRRWLDEGTALDVEAGPIMNGNMVGQTARFPGAVAQVSVNWNDEIGVVLGAELMRLDGRRPDVGLSVGIRAGSTLGVVTGTTYFVLRTLAVMASMGGT